MKKLAGFALMPLLAAFAPFPQAFAQPMAYSYDRQMPDRPAFSQAGLDQMLAPIALYPDALLAQILMASTYPLEVAQAARLSRANPQLRADEAVRAVEPYGLDPSVNALMAFPQLLAMMDQRIDWTEQLGDAFLDQQSRVMESVQSLRHRAWMAGNLQSNEQVRVVRQETVLMLEQAYPQVAYVPYYDPLVIYGAWWWPALPPVHWEPWAGFRPRPGFSNGFFHGAGVSVRPDLLFGGFDWPRRQVCVVNINNNDYNSNNAAITNRAIIDARRGNDAAAVRAAVPAYWQHDPVHRRGVPSPDSAMRAYTPPHRESRPTPLPSSVPRPAAALPAMAPPEQARNPQRDAQHAGRFEHARRAVPESTGMPARGTALLPEQRAAAPQAARAIPPHEPRVVVGIDHAAPVSAVRAMPPASPVRPVADVRPPHAAVGERPSGAHGHDGRDSPAVAQRAPEPARAATQAPANARPADPAARPADPAARPAGPARADGARVRREG